jgi:hypothetical protein
MTVIAWDGKTLAADKRATTEDGAIAVTTKLYRIGDALAAHTGESSVGRDLLEWFRAGAVLADFPTRAREDKATLIVIRQGEIMAYVTGPHPTRYEMLRMAWGCGRDFAMGAMQCGKTASEAVAIACELNAFCGNGIDTLEL